MTGICTSDVIIISTVAMTRPLSAVLRLIFLIDFTSSSPVRKTSLMMILLLEGNKIFKKDYVMHRVQVWLEVHV